VLSLVADHRGQSIVVVSHADPIKVIEAAAAGVPLDLFQRLVVSPCSVSAVLYGGSAPMVLCLNSTGSLNDLVPS
jgi:broad specificity phosphatase PhoE